MHQAEQRLVGPRAALRFGAICAITGSLAVFGFRLAHGDLPAGDAPAALRFITQHPFYAGVHLGTILGVLVWVGAMILLSGTLEHGSARLLATLGVASLLVGAAIFIVDFSIDGVGGQDLAQGWAAAPPARQADFVLAAQTAFTALRGTSLIAIVILWGVPLVLFGRAVTQENYPAWLGSSGVVVGVTTMLGAIALLLQPDLFPGVLVYGLLVSILVQLWGVALGVMMWRRASVAYQAADVGAARSSPSN